MCDRLWVGLALAGLTIAGCDTAENEPGGGAPPADTVVADSAALPVGLIEGTPPGGLEDWLADIEAGLPASMEEVSSEFMEMQRSLLNLYVGRQEYLEMYWGPSGRLQAEGGAALGEAVIALETAFHGLLQVFVAQPLDTAGVAAAVVAMRERAAEVRRVAAESGLPLVPPGNRPAGPRE